MPREKKELMVCFEQLSDGTKRQMTFVPFRNHFMLIRKPNFVFWERLLFKEIVVNKSGAHVHWIATDGDEYVSGLSFLEEIISGMDGVLFTTPHGIVIEGDFTFRKYGISTFITFA